MLRIKSFQRRIFLTLLAVAFLPSLLLLATGTAMVQWAIPHMGTAGAWGSVAESGQQVLQRLEEAQISDPAILEAASAHEAALSESLRQSQVFTVLWPRFLGVLFILGLVLALLVAGLAYFAARQLSRGFSRPIHELVGWTQLIGKEEELPPPGRGEARGTREFATLRAALRQMAADLEEGRRQAIQNAKLRSWTEMARRVAHELKNPLTPMRMAAEAVAESESADSRQAGTVLLEEIARLDEMARTFSQFGRMPEGPPSEIDVSELLNELASQHEGVGPTIQLKISGTIPLVLGHFDSLTRCFRNLLLNALEAAGASGRVEISSWREGEAVITEIRDTGPGIEEEALGKIWDPDFTTKSRGTGLGLPLVLQAIRTHHGTVEARNHPDAGAIFRVELPLEGPGQGTPDTSSTQAAE